MPDADYAPTVNVVVGLGTNCAVIWRGGGVVGIEPLFVKLGSGALVLVWNFGARKLLLF